MIKTNSKPVTKCESKCHFCNAELKSNSILAYINHMNEEHAEADSKTLNARVKEKSYIQTSLT